MPDRTRCPVDAKPGPVTSAHPSLVASLVRRLALDRMSWVDVVLLLIRIGFISAVVIGSTRTFMEGRFSAAQWGTLISAGVAQGSIYSLIALGYTLVYGILRLINFAHGDVFMFGAFCTVFLAIWTSQQGILERAPAITVLSWILFAALVSMSVAVLVERLAYKPLRNKPRLVMLISAIGASFFLQYTARGFFSTAFRSYPTVPGLDGRLELGQITVPHVQITVFAVALTLMAGLYILVEKTRIGRAMRAVSENMETARLMGVNIERVIMFTFGVGGALAGAAGVINGLYKPQGVSFIMGFFPGVKAFTAAVLGGIGSVPGALIGGLLLGIFEALGPNLVLTGLGIPGSNQLKDVIAFLMLVLILIFRPQGIMGEVIEEEKA